MADKKTVDKVKELLERVREGACVAADCAADTARVAKLLDLSTGVKNYAELNGVLWHSMHSTKDYFPTFRTPEKALSDPRLKKLHCPVCGETLTVPEFTVCCPWAVSTVRAKASSTPTASPVSVCPFCVKLTLRPTVIQRLRYSSTAEARPCGNVRYMASSWFRMAAASCSLLTA